MYDDAHIAILHFPLFGQRGGMRCQMRAGQFDMKMIHVRRAGGTDPISERAV